ncbi:hypothetical protein LTR10_017176 [Elasticomyces elasticus]|uniref:Uncharacterized protein n=1 Tax=Exophiala sideris TaxID=1016849 RepID=A0ABR0J560_9EURO|nr:hypothetical protein LTR10_017176 [Elasticomyces elasticus]KAK5028468.1 hypothetical protein LTS07_006559 [Exophiala sideris]KAK5035890.1 hypothetical protein LTR13_005460 [Exophiala sideris]KAK5056926.1 hypothetical protein LTR69_007564 [Exophiala sideris]KAK5181333.1 hypothetical protein LTR44_006128 [Eurotiomycetes sp. CCFEE 6388]
MSGILKLVGSGVGLAKEYRAYRKASKASEAQENAFDDDQVSKDNMHEPVGLSVPHADTKAETYTTASAGEGQDARDLPDPSFQRIQEPPPYAGSGRLSLPVILPQRRPRNNSRGFVQAYAQALKECGIDQTQFLDFLNGFHEAIKATPLFHIANAAVAIGSFPIPSMAVQVSALALGVALEISSKQFMKYQTNKYLDRMNEEIFKPRGLYTAIMTFEPGSFQAGEVVDVNTNVVKSFGDRIGIKSERFRTSSGKTHGDVELPEAAPLVFPKLNELPDDQRKNKMNKTGFLDDYLDRRAQAKFDQGNPGSRLVVSRPKFVSKWSDPTHPVHSASSLRTMVGAITGRGGGDDPRSQLGRLEEDARYEKEAEKSSSLRERMMQKPVLYLMVVNMPSEEELRIANGLLAQSGMH